MNREWIRKLAGQSVYKMGLEVWNNGGIIQFDVEEDEDREDVERIRALVQGSGKKVYEVQMEYDYFADEPLGLYCACPVFTNTEGICKHCVAALLQYDYEFGDEEDYEDEETDQLSLEDYMDASGKFHFSDAAFGRRAGKETTPTIRNLLNRQASKGLLALTQGQSYGRVKLETTLHVGYRDFTLSFEIGITRMYVLKDIEEFAARIRNMEDYSYGKQLQFVHTLDAFTPDSRKAVDFLVRWAEHNGERFRYGGYYGYGYGKLRYISLEANMLEEFLLSMGDSGFLVDKEGMRTSIWHVSKDGLPRHMTLKGDPDGVQMSLEKNEGYVGNRYLIYFREGTIYLDSRDRLAPIQDFIMEMGKVPGREAFINEKDLPAFCRTLLPQLKKFYEVEYVGFDEEKYAAQQVKFEIYLDAPQRDFVTCNLKAVYGQEKYDVFGDSSRFLDSRRADMAKRDILLETETGKAVQEWFNAYDEKNCQMVLADDDEKMYRLLTEGIAALQQVGDVFVSDALKRFRIVESPRMELGVSVSGDMLNLQVTSQELSMEQLAEVLSRYERKKKFYRLKNGEFVELAGEGLEKAARMAKELGLSDAQLKKEKIAVPRYRLLYLEDELEDSEGFEVRRDDYYRELVERTERMMEKNWELPESFAGIMRDYQKKGFEWLMRITRSGFGGILADDMGLGKTLQVIALIFYEYIRAGEKDNRRTLIVTPASLVYNWESELERFAPKLPVVVVAGNAEQRAEQLKNVTERDILITSYDLLRRDIENYEQIPFYLEVIDEAQFIKNHNTQAARAVKGISAKCRLALTGTPIENRLSELWSIFDYLMPGFLYSYQRFRGEIELPAIQGESKEPMERLKKLVRPFILRRLKEDVLTDLPDKIEENMYVKLSGEQLKLYDAHVQRLRLMLDKQSDEEFKTAKIQVLSELTRLRELCCDPALIYEGYADSSAKSDMCIDLIENAIAGGHRILLFSQFTSMLERLEERLREKEIPFYTITGQTPKDRRVNLVEGFNGGSVPVFCISLKAGGTGLNLTAADIVIHYDPWWNLAVQNQATDRAHRIGQKNIVTVYKLIARGTIEENIIKLQEKKKELADQILSGEDLGTGSFTREELLELLK